VTRTINDARADAVGACWRAAGRDKWFRKDDAFDAAIRQLFGALHTEAAAGGLDGWAEAPEPALALILVLDQFSRNLHRNSADAFAQDEKALAIARHALARGFDTAVEAALRSFFYMPFLHAEDLAAQEECVRIFEAHGDENGLEYAIIHRDFIA